MGKSKDQQEIELWEAAEYCDRLLEVLATDPLPQQWRQDQKGARDALDRLAGKSKDRSGAITAVAEKLASEGVGKPARELEQMIKDALSR